VISHILPALLHRSCPAPTVARVTTRAGNDEAPAAAGASSCERLFGWLIEWTHRIEIYKVGTIVVNRVSVEPARGMVLRNPVAQSGNSPEKLAAQRGNGPEKVGSGGGNAREN